MRTFKSLFLFVVVSVNLLAISNSQIKNLQVAYSIGKITVAKDGMTFERTLASIMLTESSARTNIDGDDGKSLGPMQIQIPTIRWMGKMIPEIDWVNTLTDKQLKEKLTSSVIFSCMLAGYYIRLNYNNAIKKKMRKPYFKAISHYNGGWNNKTYFKRVMKNMKIINRLIAEGKIK